MTGVRMGRLEALSVALSAVPRYTHNGTTYADGVDIGGTRRGLLRRYCYGFAGKRCFWCGDMTVLEADKRDPSLAQLGHVIPGGPKRTGFFPGNLGNMCQACNADAGDRDLSTRLGRAALPEAIPMEWPDFKSLAIVYPGTDYSAEWSRRRANRPAWD